VPLAQQQQQLDLYANAPVQLSKCRKCGRGFSYDRIQYHESVCIGNKSRKQFNSKKQRLSDFDQCELRPAAGGGGGRKGGSSVNRPAPNRTSWRQQHSEFISAIRAAKQYSSKSKPQYAMQAPGRGAPQQGRQPFASSALRNPQMYRNPPQAARSAPQSVRNVLPKVSGGGGPGGFQFEAPQQIVQRGGAARGNAIASGGYNAPRSGGGGGFAAALGGGGPAGKFSIVNSNVTSEGMLQAFGRR
jgi:hypothetical protein